MKKKDKHNVHRNERVPMSKCFLIIVQGNVYDWRVSSGHQYDRPEHGFGLP